MYVNCPKAQLIFTSILYYFLRRVQRRASEKLRWEAAKSGAEKKGKNDDNLKTNWQ